MYEELKRHGMHSADGDLRRGRKERLEKIILLGLHHHHLPLQRNSRHSSLRAPRNSRGRGREGYEGGRGGKGKREVGRKEGNKAVVK